MQWCNAGDIKTVFHAKETLVCLKELAYEGDREATSRISRERLAQRHQQIENLLSRPPS